MKLTRIAVDRPIMTSMVVGIVLVVSSAALFRLPIDLMPDVSFPSISISVTYDGATPEEIETLVTRPIEEVMGSVENVEVMETTSSEEQALIRLRFAWGQDLDEAANEVRQRLDRVRGVLPDDVQSPVLYKFDFNQRPIIRFGLSSPSIDISELRYLSEHTLKPRLERIPGIASVNVGGGRVREIQVNLSQEKLDALQLSPATIVQAIRAENINMPAGEVFSGETQVVMRTQGQFLAPNELENIVIATREGVPIYLRDVADVNDGYEEQRQVERINGEPGITLSIVKQSGGNTVAVADAAHAEFERIGRDYPYLNVITLSDSSDFIRDAISNVRMAVFFGGILAVVILMLFLRNLRSTLIIASAIPISVMAAFSMIYFAGFTLNIVSFGGLALGVGLLVDNSIVVLENIFRHRESGEEPRSAAIEGTREVSTAIIASTLTTLVVFLPLLFITGAASVMFTQLAYVVAFSLVCSLLVSLTLIPTLACRLLRVESLEITPNESIGHKLYRLGEDLFQRMEQLYRRLLHGALSHRYLVVVVSMGLLAASLPMFRLLGFEYMPSTDEGEIRVYGRMAPGARLEALDQAFRQVEHIIERELGDEVANIHTRFGMAQWWRAGGSNTGRVEIQLKPLGERKRSTEEISESLREDLNQIVGLRAYARAGGGMFIFRMLQPEGEKIAVEIRGYDREEAYRIAEEVREKLEGIEGISDAQLSRTEGRPEIALQIDRRRAAEAGLTVTWIAQNIRTNFGGEIATRYREGGDEYDVRVRLEEGDRQTLKDLRDHWVVTPSGERVPASNFLTETRTIGPTRISRKNQERQITVAANLEPGYKLGNVMREVEAELSGIRLPQDFALVYGGEYEEQQKSYRELMLGLMLAVLLVYMVMAAQFESFVHPLIIMFAIPFAAIGVLLSLFITGTTVSVQSILGVIMLVGIVVNNAILLVDCINLLRRERKLSLLEAVEQGGLRRLRPILMTTFTTALALVPMALGLGSGGELQAPMARVVIGGILTSTLITLILIPILYASVEQWFERRRESLASVSSQDLNAPVTK